LTQFFSLSDAYQFVYIEQLRCKNDLFSTKFDVNLFLVLSSSSFPTWRSPLFVSRKEKRKDIRQNLAIALRSGLLGGKKYAATILMRITIVREEIQLEREMQL